jgi:hypothetical protein
VIPSALRATHGVAREQTRALYVGARFEATWIDAGGGPSLPWLFGPSATRSDGTTGLSTS